MACTTDISKLKWAHNFQARLATEAREAKRQQEAFIDMVSHEMRNPLSAIVHCADGISSCVEDCQSHLDHIPKPCLDAGVDQAIECRTGHCEIHAVQQLALRADSFNASQGIRPIEMLVVNARQSVTDKLL